ncbi:MAG: hypothetical protein HFI81_06240 [Eubacterium sp.]|nr:hypothetical protein [Eubacterium sp.]
MKIDIIELPESSDGEFKKYSEIREYPEEGKRHCDLCVFCGFPSYPKCMEWCPNGGNGSSKG